MSDKPDKTCLVALTRCDDYTPRLLREKVALIFQAAGFQVRSGSTVLLKPNLVSSGGSTLHLACTSPQVVAAAAEWCLDHGARVLIGDSPAFGTGRMVMRACGMAEALKPLGVKSVDFSRTRQVQLPSGFRVPVAVAPLECDLLLNLPRVKAHNQLYVTLAAKNYFGVVAGWRKALHHAVNGEVGNRFEALLADLPDLFPGSFSLIDGIVAMHRAGPMKGEPFPLRVLGGSFDPVALDTAVMMIIGADPRASQLWREFARRGRAGCDPVNITFPLHGPAALRVEGFRLPSRLSPVSFHPARLLAGACRRLAAGLSNG